MISIGAQHQADNPATPYATITSLLCAHFSLATSRRHSFSSCVSQELVRVRVLEQTPVSARDRSLSRSGDQTRHALPRFLSLCADGDASKLFNGPSLSIFLGLLYVYAGKQAVSSRCCSLLLLLLLHAIQSLPTVAPGLG